MITFRIYENKRLKKQERKNKDLERKAGLEELARRAEKKGKAFDKMEEKSASAENSTFYSQDAENSRKGFFRKLRTVISSSDIIVQVLDARDPNSCRSPDAPPPSTGLSR